MTKLTYTCNNGKTVSTYAEAMANGGIKVRHYEPVAEPVAQISDKKKALRVKI